MTKAIILAAGQGIRLRPLTENTPKCMVEVFGRSILQHQLNVLEQCGVHKICAITGFQSHAFDAFPIQTFHNPDYLTSNMVLSLMCAREFIEDANDDVLIVYGDIIFQATPNLEALLSSKEDIALMIDKNWRNLWSLRMDDPLNDAETLKMSAGGAITEIGKKPESYEEIEGQYTGLIKIKGSAIPNVLKCYDELDREALYDGKDFRNMYMTSFLQNLIDASHKVSAVEVQGGWLEVDSVEDWELYSRLYETNELEQIIDLGAC